MFFPPGSANRSQRSQVGRTNDRKDSKERNPLIRALALAWSQAQRRYAPLHAIRQQGLCGDQLGLAGERVVARALRRAGWRQLGARLATSDAELDLLMLDGETLVAVEVKTGHSKLRPEDFEEHPLWRPGHRFKAQDLARIRRATQCIAERQSKPFRIDLVELVLFESNTTIFHHIEICDPLERPQEQAFW